MKRNSNLFICQEIIQYLLDSANYSLKTIADLTNTSITKIQGIYYENEAPLYSTEMLLLEIYQFIRGLKNKNSCEIANL